MNDLNKDHNNTESSTDTLENSDESVQKFLEEMQSLVLNNAKSPGLSQESIRNFDTQDEKKDGILVTTLWRVKSEKEPIKNGDCQRL